MSRRKQVGSQAFAKVLIGVSFGLAILDMLFLRGPFENILETNLGFASLIALVIATAANFFAFGWGQKNGENLARGVNRHSVMYFILWAAMGIAYVLIRAADIWINVDKGNVDGYAVLGNIVQYIILAISFIGTGLVISSEVAKIYDADISEYKTAKKEFQKSHDEMTDMTANLVNLLGIMGNYGHYMDSLDTQYNKIRQSIKSAERSVLAEVKSKTLSKNPEINPVDANAVMDKILERRSQEDERIRARKEKPVN